MSELLAHRAVHPPPSSSLAEETTPPLASPPCGGARFPDARSSVFELLAHREVTLAARLLV
jgi:hypothetical protein